MKEQRNWLLILTGALIILYAYTFIKPSYLFPGLQERVLLVLIPFGLITLLLYIPWKKVERGLNSAMRRIRLLLSAGLVTIAKLVPKRKKGTKIKKIVQALSQEQKVVVTIPPLKTMIKYVFLVLLFFVAFSSLRFEFITSVGVLASVQAFLLQYQLALTITTILFGVITFWQNRDVMKEVEIEQSKEEAEEKKRAKGLDKKYKKLAKLNFEYGIRDAWKKKQYDMLILRVLIAPFVWIGRIPYSLVKWMYKEGWWYSGLFFALLLLAFILGLFVIKTMIVTVDEGYTLNSINSYHQFGIKGLTESGADYDRAGIYTIISSLFFPLFGDVLVGLRFFSFLLYLLLIGITYFLAKELFKNKKIALIAAALLGINWFFITVALTARNYVFSLVIFSLMIYLSIKNGRSKSNNFILYVLLILLFFLNYFEGFPIFSLHFLVFFAIIELIKRKLTYKYILFIVGSVAVAFLVLLFTFKSSIIFIINTFQINLSKIYWEAIMFNGSVFSILPVVGLILVFSVILFSIFYLNRNKEIFTMALFILLVLFVQVCLFTSRRSYPRYLADLIIPLILLLSFYIFFQFRRKRFSFVLLIILLVILTSVLNIISILNQDLGYSYYQPNNWEEAINIVPKNAIIVTDMPNTVKIFRQNQIIYAFRDDPDDPELVYGNGSNYFDSSIHQRDSRFTKYWQIDYFKNIELEGYILTNESNQLYLYYDKTPKIMTKEQLIHVSLDKSVYFILSHNAFENKNMRDNYDLRTYAIDNSILVYGGENQSKYSFDLRNFDTDLANPKMLSVLKLNI